MKMKNMLIGGMSLALVACISVGGTLAYLTANDGALTNNFEFSKDGITLDLWENASDVAGSDVATKKEIGKVDGVNATDTGFAYKNVIPGATYLKDVNITIGEKTVYDTIVFVQIDAPTNVSVNYDEVTGVGSNGWTLLTGEVSEGVNVPDNTYYKVWKTTDSSKNLDLFQHVTINNGVTSSTGVNGNLGDVKIQVKGIQAYGFVSASGTLDNASALNAYKQAGAYQS